MAYELRDYPENGSPGAETRWHRIVPVSSYYTHLIMDT